MEAFMLELANVFVNQGLWIGIIALVGVAFLGVLKYSKVFDKITNDTTRKITYLLCSVGLSLVGCLIFYWCTGFNWETFFAIAGIIWALNQTAYVVFKTTKLNDLVSYLFGVVVNFIQNKFLSKKEEVEDTKDEE